MNSTVTNSTLCGFSKYFTDKPIIFFPLMSFQFFFGVSLNCYIIFLFLCSGRGVDISLVFTLNHCAAEILFSIAGPLNIFIAYTLQYAVQLTFLSGSSICARLLFPCCVCLERYLAVVHPVTFLRLKPLRYRVASSGLVWVFSLLLGISIVTSGPFIILFIMFLVVLAVEFFCCVMILRRLRDPGPRDMGREQGEMNAAKKKAFQIVFINLLTCVAQNVPIAVSYALKTRQLCTDLTTVQVICVALNIFAGFVQPAMILHKAGKLSFVRSSCSL